MSCFRPLKAYWANVERDRIVFDPVRSATKVPFMLPCSRCIGCRMDRAFDWGMRCMHEKRMHKDSCFVTLTYNDKHMPPGGSLQLRDVQLFMKRLRKAKEPNKVRFFLGAEYGDDNRRPHYHALLFNCSFSDRLFFNRNSRGEPLYTSRELETLWSRDGESMGFCTIGEVTVDSAVYCAKYALKKLNITEHSSPEAKEEWCRRYEVFDEDGVCYTRKQEFALMSRRPGIGAGYLEKYRSEMVAHDNVIIDGREVPLARFYDVKLQGEYPGAMSENKRLRKRAAVLNREDNTQERLRVKERLAEIAAEQKERKL